MVAQPALAAPDQQERPPLESGDRLDRCEFERRYTMRPDIKKAELIEGVVYVASPVRILHAEPHAILVGWVTAYALATPGVMAADNATVRLEGDNEVQPDALLRYDEEHRGKSRETTDHYLEGPPELAVEVAASSASYDLNVKKELYRHSGVREYVAWQIYEKRIDWFQLRRGRYVALKPNAEGVIESGAFPGLRLNVRLLLAGDYSRVIADLAL